MKYFLLTITSVLLLSCSSNKNEETVESYNLVPASWIEQRVKKAEEYTSRTAGGRLIWESIEAHGGLQKWFSNGALSFHFDYQPLDGKVRRNSFQTINQWSVQSVHELASNRSIQFGWDGSEAWIIPDTAQVPVNVRFWANTPFYFVGLPFVLADEGINYEVLPVDTLDQKVYDLVKVTFSDGVGDASEDFYVIYIDQQTKLMGALRYIVSYPGFFPDGGHSPEKIMKIKSLADIEGIRLPTGYETYWWKDDQIGEHITHIEVTEISFKKELPKDYFNKPEGARVQESM
ncbi:MAG: hypothetical protein CMB80_32170 [Flammeovirgaceae bacterium]|nr:hypothetical protein [Flammeovirgaceae bacterium]HCX24012.1 hypothetical protein [Cytophagales bacterium]|tara:strand:- start:11620 stop:12486 length:867 start_codon:yes stop_codon:yes gene_type:complete